MKQIKPKANVTNYLPQTLQLLQQKQLEACCKEANKELDSDFEITTFDGLDIDKSGICN